MISTLNSSTMSSYSGWIGQSYFGKNAINNYIINCSSDGPINEECGGIVGKYAANNGGVLKIIGCSSSGNIGTRSGGIVGNNAAANGTIICESCWSTGDITDGGGIFGNVVALTDEDLPETASIAIAKNCYSIGDIISSSLASCGIYGNDAGYHTTTPHIDSTVIAENCYSLGNINGESGGIFGASANDICNAINCYSNHWL